MQRRARHGEPWYLALLERASEGISQRMDEAVAGDEGPRAKLKKFVAAMLDYFDEQPHLFDLWVLNRTPRRQWVASKALDVCGLWVRQ